MRIYIENSAKICTDMQFMKQYCQKAQITDCRKLRSVNDELEGVQKETLAYNLRRYPGNSMEGSGKIKANLRIFWKFYRRFEQGISLTQARSITG